MMKHKNPTEILGDHSPMPFGKYEGIRLEQVPAAYLIWLSRQDWIEDWPALYDYIEDNMHVLEHELKYGR